MAYINEEKINYKYESHTPTRIKGIPWTLCKHCGLVYLKNSLTQWCIAKGCLSCYHSDYNSVLRKLT